ncbi:MAG TPA: amino acid adenylation domain-containing protein, partial [Longimicrobium sp.]
MVDNGTEAADHAAPSVSSFAGSVGEGALQAQAEYWKHALAGAPEVLELPTNHTRPLRPDHAGGRVPVELDEALTAGLHALSLRNGTSLFTTLLAGWAVVLSRLSGQENLVVGAGSPGALQALWLDLAGTPSGAELLARVKTRVLDARHNADLPLERVAELVRGPGGSLFQVAMEWTETPVGAADEGAEPDGTKAELDLALDLRERAGRIVGGLTYATAIFERATAERFAGYLRRVLAGMVADETVGVGFLQMMEAEERELVLNGLNATAAEYPTDLLVHQLFAAQAERTPDAIAISWRGEQWTYAELQRRVNQLANALRRRGVGPEVRVGVSLPRTPEILMALLGVLTAGGAYVPLDPAYPRERIGFMLEDAGIDLILTDSRVAGRLPEDGAELLLLDREREALATESTTTPESGVLPENLSHVIFTSGSTGRPKGVMIRHSAVTVLLYWLPEIISDEERSSFLFATSINFDVSVAEMFGTLCWGGKLVLVENALELADVREPVIHASMVPSAAAELLRGGSLPASVRTMNLGGEALPNALAQGLYALGTVEKVGNLYGPTEDTTYSTYSLVPKGAKRVSLGRAISNSQAYVVDERFQLVPVGVTGGLYMAGAGLARGYAGRPAATAERFVPDPFGPPGSRMYEVRDRVRWAADGELEYLGRIDFQVKVRGFRIELGEIEARLAEAPGIRDAVVLAREDSPGDTRLVAYYVGEQQTVEALRAHLLERVPEYMVPAAYMRLERLPQTPNGKLDRGALPAPDASAYTTRDYEPPQGETEMALAGVWQSVLGAERVGRWDNFFDLGGHSLMAVQVATRVRQALGVEVTHGELFETPVLADLARRLEQAARAEMPEIVPVDRSQPLVTSFAQQRLWLMEQFMASGSAYHVPMRLRFTGTLDRDALRATLDRIMERHEAVRTVFTSSDGMPLQVIQPAEGMPLLEHDVRAAPDPEAAVRELVTEELRAPFDLERDPLMRGRLIQVADDEHVLLLTLHHIVSDGWSLGVVTNELGALYNAFVRGEPDPLPELPLQYADYSAWHRKLVTPELVEAQAAYWVATLAGAPELLELPTDYARPSRPGHEGASI